MRPTRSNGIDPLRRLPRSYLGVAVLLAGLLALGPSARGMSGAPPPAPDRPLAEHLEPLSAALSAGRVLPDDLRGREVYSFEEARIGTLLAAADVAVVALDPRLGLGLRCVAAPLGRLRLAAERRLLLDMTPHEFRSALAVPMDCGT
jgi:hypothetical protein